MSQGDLVRQGVLLRPTASRVGELSVNGKVALAVLGEEMARSVRVAIEVCERSSIEAQGEAQGDHGLWRAATTTGRLGDHGLWCARGTEKLCARVG